MSDEILEIVNEQDEIVGTSLKSEIHRNRLFHRSIILQVINEKNELLLQKRAANKTFDANCWTCSVTGHVSLNEDYESATLRETQEEIGLTLTTKDLVYLGKPMVFDETQKDDLCAGPTAVYLFKAKGHLEDIQIQTEELSAVRWINLASFSEMSKGKRNFYFDGKSEQCTKDLVVVLQEYAKFITTLAQT